MTQIIDLDFIQADPTLSHSLQTFLQYATHRITDQSLPIFFDGLLPAQRKLLLSMQDIGALPEKKHQKASRVVAQSTAAYHPVGSTYQVLVNMSQGFKTPHLLTDPEGNWGEPENGVAAAERYTEVRFSRFGYDVLFQDLPGERTPVTKVPHDVVPTQLTYTDLHWEETYLPARLPLLLLNGSNGIAVGIAQTFQPLTLSTVSNLISAKIAGTPILEIPLHLGYPSECAIVSSPEEVRQAFLTGRGSIKTASRYEWVTVRGVVTSLAVTAVPPGTLYNTIGDAFSEWRRSDPMCPFEEFRNETETSTRLVFVLKKNFRPTSEAHQISILKSTFRTLPLTSSQTVNMIALKDSFPVSYNLDTFLTDWVEERSRIIARVASCKAEGFKQALSRLHLTVWLKRHLDKILPHIRAIPTEEELILHLDPIYQLDFPNPITLDEVKLILSMNLRSISRIAETELYEKISRTERSYEQQLSLSQSESQQREQILKDVDHFIKSPEYQLREVKCPYDTDLTALLHRSQEGKVTVPQYQHAFEPYFTKAQELEIFSQSQKGIITRMLSRQVRIAPREVNLLDTLDYLVSADFHTSQFVILITQQGRFHAVPAEKFPLSTPVHLTKVAQLLKLEPEILSGARIIHQLVDRPTHLWLSFDDFTVKRVALTDISIMRSTVALPLPIVNAAFISEASFMTLSDGKMSNTNPLNYESVSRSRVGRLPKIALADRGIPVRVENRLAITFNRDSIRKVVL